MKALRNYYEDDNEIMSYTLWFKLDLLNCQTIDIKLQGKQSTALSLYARAASLLWITGTKLSDEQQSRMLSNSERFCLPEIAPLNFSRGKLYPALLFYPLVSNPLKNFDDAMMLWKLVLDKFVEISISVCYFMRNWSISWKVSSSRKRSNSSNCFIMSN